MDYQYYENLEAGVIAVGDPHPEFEAISEMRALPHAIGEVFITYAMREGRCDLVHHWLANSVEPDSEHWLESLSQHYSPALLNVLPQLLDSRPLSLVSARALLAYPEVRPYLAHYLHNFLPESLIDNCNLEQVRFLDTVLDLSSPTILNKVAQEAPRDRLVIQLLATRCSDLNYKPLGPVCMTNGEILASLMQGASLPVEADHIIDNVPEQFRSYLEWILLKRGQYNSCDATELVHALLTYEGSSLARLMADSIVTALGWVVSAVSIDNNSVPWYPLVWRLLYYPNQNAEEHIRCAPRNQLICARLAHTRLTDRINQLILDRLAE